MGTPMKTTTETHELPPVDVKIVAGPFRSFTALMGFENLLVDCYGAVPIHPAHLTDGWMSHCVPCHEADRLAARLADEGAPWLKVVQRGDQEIDVLVVGQPPDPVIASIKRPA
jgi:hypothetical protein